MERRAGNDIQWSRSSHGLLPSGPNSVMGAPVLRTENLHRQFVLPRESLFRTPETVYALNGVSLTIEFGRSLGVVGESGCGKSTLARLCMFLDKPTSGRVEVLGQDLSALSPSELRQARSQFQMVFQDPYGSLDPRHTVRRIVGETLDASPARERGNHREAAIGQAIDAVGLRANDLDKYPHEFSGGQRQRIAIARALIIKPKLVIFDEAVSALDVTVRAQILDLIAELAAEYGLTYLFISHDLSVIRSITDRCLVMKNGKIIEQGLTKKVLEQPQNTYTKKLIDAVPKLPNFQMEL